MSFMYKRVYNGNVNAVIFDWAGTTVDYGCFAPAAVFMEVFKQKGVEITAAQAREPMGLQKRDHIEAVTVMPAVAAKWEEVHGKACSQDDIDDMFNNFIPMQRKVVASYCDLIPGILEIMASLKERGIKVGSTTGYTDIIMEEVIPKAKEQGYDPDSIFTGDGLPGGRPAPWMIFENLKKLGVYPLESVIKVGDTVPDILEGLNAGVWSIAIINSSNEMGLTVEQVEALDEDELSKRQEKIRNKFSQAGAHYVIDDISDLMDVIDDIEFRLAMGEKP